MQQEKMLLNKKRLYNRVFNTPEGEKVLKDLMAFCHYRDLTFSPDNMYMSAFNEGKRAVILRLLNVLNISEEKLTQIINQTQEY